MTKCVRLTIYMQLNADINIQVDQMSSNPFSHIPAPLKQQPNPRNISISEFGKYQSHQMQKAQARLRVMRRSLPFMAAMGAICFVFKFMCDRKVKDDLFASDYRGGSYLQLTTIHDEDHYAYNREFQRMHVVGEGLEGDKSQHSKQLIVDLGGEIPQRGSPHIRKQAPHEKFY